MERLRADKRLMFLLIGDGPPMAWIEEQTVRRHLTNVRFKPCQRRESLVFSLGVSDVHIVSLKPVMEGLVVPSKFYGIAAAGRPTVFVGDGKGEIAKIIEHHDVGCVVPPGDGEGLARAISRFAFEPGRCQQMGNNARGMFDRLFERGLALQEWRRVLAMPENVASLGSDFSKG